MLISASSLTNSKIKISVFLSYAGEDREDANDLYKHLQKHDIDVFMDTKSLNGGTSFHDELLNRIQISDVFIVLLSKNFKKSTYTHYEIGMALAFQIPIIPISIDDTMPYEVLCGKHAIKYTSTPNEEEVKKIIDSIRSENYERTSNDLEYLITRVERAPSQQEALNKLRILSRQQLSTAQVNRLGWACAVNNNAYTPDNTFKLAQKIMKDNQSVLDYSLAEIFEIQDYLNYI